MEKDRKQILEKILNLETISDKIDKIKSEVISLEERNAKLEAENQKLKDEHYKDLELKKLKEEVDKKNSEIKELKTNSFILSENEKKIIDDFIGHHRHSDNNIDAQFEYIFTPTSLGDIGEIRCIKCNKKIEFKSLWYQYLYFNKEKKYASVLGCVFFLVQTYIK